METEEASSAVHRAQSRMADTLTLRHSAASAVWFLFTLMVSLAAQADEKWYDTGNVYLAAGIARTTGQVGGDFYAVGGQVAVDHPVQGEVFAAGGRVSVSAPVEDDLHVMGGDVTLAGAVGGEATIAAGTISIVKAARVDGRVVLAGGNVEIAGTLERGGRIFADRLVISGHVGGGLRIVASRIEITSSARIEGPIDFTSRRAPVVAPGAQVQGPVTAMPSRAPQKTAEMRRTGEWAVPLFYAGLWAAGILLLLAFPRFTVAAQDRVRASPLQSLALGAALVFALPVVAVLLIVTVVGIPVAFALIALYAVLLLAGFLTALFFVAERIGRLLRGGRAPGTGWRVALLLAALVLLALIARLPVAGGFVALVVLVFGVGALGQQLYRQYADRQPLAA
jgi:cytoskeletal protein CcmA (bactofilin family)